MTKDSTWRSVAIAGLLGMLLFAAFLAAGLWVANAFDIPRWMGWVAGALIGFLTSRTLLRAVLSHELTRGS